MSTLQHPIVRYAIMLLIAVGFIGPHNFKTASEYKAARMQFSDSAAAKATQEALKIQAAFRSIYENIRTISQLPSVKSLDRHGSNLGTDGRETVQQVYNNLAAKIYGSELYIVPAGFDSDVVDLAERQPQIKIEKFAQLIIRSNTKSETPNAVGLNTLAERTNGLLAYRRLKEHQNWLHTHHPTERAIEELNVPMVSGSEVVAANRANARPLEISENRSWLMFSVPYYGRDGALKGTVTAVIPSETIRALLPDRHYALTNKNYSYVSRTHKDGQERKSLHFVKLGVPDPDLLASSVIDIAAFDPRSEWKLWAGTPNREFHQSPVVSSIRRYEIGGYAAIFLLMGLLIFMQWEGVARIKAQRAIDIAAETKKTEQETRRLNQELEANMKMLSEAQQALVKHERLSTLGQVTATLSHEIRNPLAAIRSSLFTIRRTAEKANIKLDRPLDRADRSIARCDNLIGDFLEYTRTNKLDLKTTDAAEFLNEVLDDQVPPAGIEMTRDLSIPGPQIVIDPERFRRVIINFVDNAAQAIRDSNATNGKIDVSCRPFNGGTIISVKDNGPGIPPDVLERIFEPLFTTKSFGAGLGLATVKQLVEQHDAEIKIDTEVGVGSIFSVVLPAPLLEMPADSEAKNLETVA